MDGSIIFVSFIICAIGLTLSFVYFNSWGLVIDGLGFMLFLYGVKKDSGNNNPLFASGNKQVYNRNTFWKDNRFVCHTCALFGNPNCPRKEVLLNAEPCDSYNQSYKRSHEINKVSSEDYKCRTCSWFNSSGCKRQEKLINAEPCEDFKKSYFSTP
jgi:hypothetical protein